MPAHVYRKDRINPISTATIIIPRTTRRTATAATTIAAKGSIIPSISITSICPEPIGTAGAERPPGGNGYHRERVLGSQNGHRMVRGRPSAFRPPCGFRWSVARAPEGVPTYGAAAGRPRNGPVPDSAELHSRLGEPTSHSHVICRDRAQVAGLAGTADDRRRLGPDRRGPGGPADHPVRELGSDAACCCLARGIKPARVPALSSRFLEDPSPMRRSGA